MKLWVDDIRNAPDESWTVARTVDSAINALSRFQPDEISLDHDISHQVGMGELSRPYPCSETFRAVAHYLAVIYAVRRHIEQVAPSGQPWHPKVSIHSSNPVGGREMATILTEGGLSPVLRPMGAANRLELEV